MDELGSGWTIGGSLLVLGFMGSLLLIGATGGSLLVLGCVGGFFLIVLMGVFGRIADAYAPPTNPYDPPLEASEPFQTAREFKSEASSGRASHGIMPPGIS
jgi:hypothetical protein